MNQTAAIFHSLEGLWKFDRLIKGHGHVKGLAKFQKISSICPTLQYREDGVFYDTNGKNFKTFRDYFYQLQEEKISVYFAENPKRLMHTLTFNTSNPTTSFLVAKATHLCSCDTYDAIYRFDLPSRFVLSHFVNGPHKNYTLETTFERLLQFRV
jgi:hypothetical protein